MTDARPHKCFAEGDAFAPAGPDGAKAVRLLAEAKADGSRIFADVCRDAVARLLASPDPLGAGVLFDESELKRIAEALARAVACADLLGRARIRRRAEMTAATEGFAEGGPNALDPYYDVPEPVPVLEPQSAVRYFQRLVPKLGTSVVRYGPKLDRHAFTLAVASDQVILEKVKAAITKQLQTGQDALPAVEQIIEEAGVSDRNPQYAEAVIRTNLLDALHQGAQDELQDPDMQEAFPVWEYNSIRDGRERPTHGARDGKYYPSSVPFTAVRGTEASDVINCRCGFSPISRFLWPGMQLRGARVESEW